MCYTLYYHFRSLPYPKMGWATWELALVVRRQEKLCDCTVPPALTGLYKGKRPPWISSLLDAAQVRARLGKRKHLYAGFAQMQMFCCRF